MPVYDYDTLAYHAKERPGEMRRSLAHVPLKDIGKAVEQSVAKVGGAVKPEREAITFYLLSHAMHEIALRRDVDEPLGGMLEIVEQYHTALNNLGYRLFNYLMIITTREMRHLSGAQENSLSGEHGAACVAFTKKVKSGSQSALFNNNFDLPVGKYLDYLCDVYNKLKWNGAYGGKNWGMVTEPLRQFVNGDLSMVQLLDVGYTLEHNGGSIFNKGFHFNHKGAHMMKILDVQRGGQIPQLVKSAGVPEVQSGHQQLLSMIEAAIPDFTVNEWVNWHVVEKLGAIYKYPQEKAATDQQFGHVPAYQIEKQAVTEQAAAIKAQKAAKKAAEEGMYIEIMPGVKLKKGVMQRGN